MRVQIYVGVLFAFVGLLMTRAGEAQTFHRICNEIYTDKSLDFTENQRTLLCGGDNNAWKDVPLNQAQYHLNVFLQQMGYFQAEFEAVYDKNRLNARVGPRRDIQKVAFIGYPETISPERRRKLIGAPLTPSQLDEIQSWTQSELAANAYPCAQVELAADPETGEVRVGIAPDPYQIFGSIEREDIDGLDERALARYDAFHIGQPYDGRLLRLTSARLLTDGLLPSTYFNTSCTPEGAEITQRLIPGKPRLVTVEIGASTEEIPILRARWSNTRLGTLASSIRALASYSPREQTLRLSGDAYFDPNLPGLSFAPSLDITRDTPDAGNFELFRDSGDIQTVTTTLSFFAHYMFDDYQRRYDILLGPALENKDKIRGDTGQDETYAKVDSRIEIMDHEYEISIGDPVQGYLGSLNLEFRERGLYSEITSKRAVFDYKHLWNYGHFAPPLLITGVRFNYSTLVLDSLEEARNTLTEDEFFRLGGDQNVRGFGFEELKGFNSLGFVSTVYLGIETRLVGELPWGIQPILFVDAAKAAEDPNGFSDVVYWSPGAGARIATPFGVFRAYAAHGYISGLPESQIADRTYSRARRVAYREDREGMNYFLSYGREF